MNIEESTMSYTFILSVATVVIFKISNSDACQQPQLVQKSTNPDIFSSEFTSRLGAFKLLKLPPLCSFKKLSECHTNSQQYDLYYVACFSDVCERDSYYCINGDRFTLHICGYMPECKRRYRNAVEYNSTYVDNVDVYSIQCPDGYFQFNVGNCFNPCLKDDSVVVIKHSTSQDNAQGYCNSDNEYCHPSGITVFELASENDVCLSDTECGEADELLPNCSCSSRCSIGKKRSLSSNFICEWIYPITTTIQSTVTKIHVSSDISSQKPRETEPNDPKNTKDYLATIIVVSCLVAIVSLGLMFYKIYQKGYDKVPTENNENTDDQDDTAPDRGTIASKTVAAKKIETEIYNTNTFKANGDIIINISNSNTAASEITDRTYEDDLSDEENTSTHKQTEV